MAEAQVSPEYDIDAIVTDAGASPTGHGVYYDAHRGVLVVPDIGQDALEAAVRMHDAATRRPAAKAEISKAR